MKSFAKFNKKDTLFLKKNIFIFLKKKANQHPFFRSRFCVHKNAKEKLQQMIICLNKKCKIEPHLHLNEHETFLILHVKIKVKIINKNKKFIKSKILSASGRKSYFFYSMQRKKYHQIESISPFSIYLETTKGPHKPSKTVFLTK